MKNDGIMRSPNTTINRININKHQYTMVSKQARTENTKGFFNVKYSKNAAIENM